NTKYGVLLTEAERARLHTLLGRGTGPARRLAHARILLKANQGEGGPGWTDAAIAGALEVHPATVSRVRREYVTAGLDAALERKVPEAVCAEARRRAGSAPDRPRLWRPARRPHALDAPAARRRAGAPGGSGRRVARDSPPSLQANQLKPWLKEQWCIPPTANAEFVWHMADVLDVYTRPYDPR